MRNPTGKMLVCLLLFAGSIPAWAQRDFSQVQIETTKLTDTIYMLVGSGGNIGVSAGEDGVFIIDDQFAPLTDKINAAIDEISDAPVRFVINTHFHGDHTGGNENFGKQGAVIIAHDNVRVRMSAEEFNETLNANAPATPEGAWPVITFSQDMTMHLNGDNARVFHVDNAHTDGDAIIHFKDANIFHMGDTFFAGRFPYIDLDSGGSVDGVIDAANRVLSLSNDETRIIPGHGPLCTPEDLKEYRDMLMKVRAAVALHIAEGKSLEEVKAANPTEGYEDWGSGFINFDRFMDILYRDLSE